MRVAALTKTDGGLVDLIAGQNKIRIAILLLRPQTAAVVCI